MRKTSTSVIISSRDDHAYLWRCVDTLLSSPCDDVEFVLVDDGSLDDPFDFLLLPRYRQGPLIRSHRCVDRAGLGIARRTGAELAEGQTLIFLDARTSVPDGYIDSCLRQVAENRNIVFTPATCEIDRKSWLPDVSRRYQILFDERFDFHWVGIGRQGADAIPMTSPASTCISRDLYEACGGFGRHESGNLDHLWFSASVYAVGGAIHMMHEADVGYLARDRFRPNSERAEAKIEFCRTVFGSLRADELDRALRDDGTRRISVTAPGDVAAGGRLGYANYLHAAVGRSGGAGRPGRTNKVSATEDPILPEEEERFVGFRDTTVRLSTNSTRLLAQFDRRYGMLGREVGRRESARLSVIKDQDQYRLSGPYGVAAGDYKAVRTLVKEQLVGYLCQQNSDLLWFHAGAVSTGSAAIVFVGPFGCGKSSLVIEMCELDYRYLSDDVIPVDPTTGKVFPFPISPFLRKGEAGQLTSDQVLRLSVESPSLTDRALERVPVPIKAVVLPRYQHAGEQRITSTSASAGFLEMLQRCFNLSDGGVAVARLSAVAAATPFAAVSFRSAAAAAAEVALWEKKL